VSYEQHYQPSLQPHQQQQQQQQQQHQYSTIFGASFQQDEDLRFKSDRTHHHTQINPPSFSPTELHVSTTELQQPAPQPASPCHTTPPQQQKSAAAMMMPFFTLIANKRIRNMFNVKQIEILERVFEQTHYPDATMREQLSRTLGLSVVRIQVWFQNRRAKYKKLDASSLPLGASSRASGKSGLNSKMDGLFDANAIRNKLKALSMFFYK
jgi:paired mesoderm homeobox protein 2